MRVIKFAAIYKFVINKIANFYFQNGTITLSGEVDREQRDTYTLIILAKDNAEIDSRQVILKRINYTLLEIVVIYQSLVLVFSISSDGLL